MRKNYDLSLRETHTYVGTYRDLDEWRSIGTYEVLASDTRDLNDDLPDGSEPDMCEPMETIKFVCVESSETPKAIERALSDTYTAHDCAHDYDCCGCRSYHARAWQMNGSIYMVKIGSSRNY